MSFSNVIISSKVSFLIKQKELCAMAFNWIKPLTTHTGRQRVDTPPPRPMNFNIFCIPVSFQKIEEDLTTSVSENITSGKRLQFAMHPFGTGHPGKQVSVALFCFVIRFPSKPLYVLFSYPLLLLLLPHPSVKEGKRQSPTGTSKGYFLPPTYVCVSIDGNWFVQLRHI